MFTSPRIRIITSVPYCTRLDRGQTRKGTRHCLLLVSHRPIPDTFSPHIHFFRFHPPTNSTSISCTPPLTPPKKFFSLSLSLSLSFPLHDSRKHEQYSSTKKIFPQKHSDRVSARSYSSHPIVVGESFTSCNEYH